PIFYSSESIPLQNSESILTGPGEWSHRMRLSLKYIDLKYSNILLLVEEFIPQKVNHNILELSIEYHIRHADLTKFGYFDLFKLNILKNLTNQYFTCKQELQPYRISHQPIAIWKRSFLEETLRKDVCPAGHEIEVNDDLQNGDFGKKNIVCITTCKPQLFRPGLDQGEIIEYHHAIFRGKEIKYTGKYD